ncbi:MnhB domain-containing protein [Deinococcus lacus]|uniref:MnhB domain-containing protein n=1 Tax=Deinococcus lacus TaxID=392561 RepID=A0ABW1YHB1_9DEIO
MTPMPKRPGTAGKSALPGKLERAKPGRVRHQGGAQSTGRAAIPPSVQNDPILRSVTRPAFALIMLLTLLLFWRGHQAPGGGFVGGAMTVCAVLLYRIAVGTSPLKFSPARLIPWGLGLSFMTGFVPYLLGKPFLKSDYGYLTTALTGEFEWASALLFDLGVFLLVIGGGLSIAFALIEVEPTEEVD